MAIITIDTEKDSKEHILHTIDYLNKILGSQPQVNFSTDSPAEENSDLFGNNLPSSGPQVAQNTSANDLLNMCDDDESQRVDEEEREEIKPEKGLTDFSKFMPY